MRSSRGELADPCELALCRDDLPSDPDDGRTPNAQGARGAFSCRRRSRPGYRTIPERLFTWLTELPQSEVLSLLALCVSLTVDAAPSDEITSAGDEFARAAGLDMGTWWSPTVEGYLACVSKARILEIVREAVSAEVAAAISTDEERPTRRARRKAARGDWLAPDVPSDGIIVPHVPGADREVGARAFVRGCPPLDPDPEWEIRRGSSGAGLRNAQSTAPCSRSRVALTRARPDGRLRP